MVGQRTERFRQVTLTSVELGELTIAEAVCPYDGDGGLLKLGLEAYSLGIAHEFDPYFGLSISRVDPLPHQLEAVYEYFMKLPSGAIPAGRRRGSWQDHHGRSAHPRAQAPGHRRASAGRLPCEPDLSVAAGVEREVRPAIPGDEGLRHPATNSASISG